MSNRSLAAIVLLALAGAGVWAAYAVLRLDMRHGVTGYVATGLPFAVTLGLLLRGYAHLGKRSNYRRMPAWVVPVGSATLGSIAISAAKTTWVVDAVAGGAGVAMALVIAGLGGAAWLRGYVR